MTDKTRPGILGTGLIAKGLAVLPCQFEAELGGCFEGRNASRWR